MKSRLCYLYYEALIELNSSIYYGCLWIRKTILSEWLLVVKSCSISKYYEYI